MKKFSKGNIIGIVIAILAVAILIGGCSTDGESSIVNKIKKNCDISEELAKDVYDKSKSVGISDETLKDIEPGEDGYTFQIDYESSVIRYGASDTEVYKIAYGYNDAMLYGASGVVGQLSDYAITKDDYIEIVSYTEYLVEKYLKSPSTAEWESIGTGLSDGWDITKDKDIFYVKTYVDSQNSFGAMIRSEIKLECTYDGESDPVAKKLVIGNETIFDYIEGETE